MAAQRRALYFNAFRPRLFTDPRPISDSGPLQMGGRWYKQVDNGRANTLVPIEDPTVSPVQRAQQRAAIDRVLLMANSPLAGAAYGIAAGLGASPSARDRAMNAGLAVDTVMQGVAPLGAHIRSPIGPPPTRPPQATLARGPIWYGRTTPTGQATGGYAMINKPMLGTGRGVNRRMNLLGRPSGSGNVSGVDRSHLVARSVGGAAQTPAQAVALTKEANRGPMRDFERQVERRVRDGEVVDYFVTPLYDDPYSAPSSILMSAFGSNGDFVPAIIPNPIDRRR